MPVEDKFDKDLITNYQYLDPTEAKDFYTIETYENLGEVQASHYLGNFGFILGSHRSTSFLKGE